MPHTPEPTREAARRAPRCAACAWIKDEHAKATAAGDRMAADKWVVLMGRHQRSDHG
ncbi:hypothetical protein ACWD4B_32755 [Streptomyces sp. NPDC002536]|uniref:hypothetical protein n=1 Tax=Streptomyces TaxID=1883 RepID=UPI0036BA1326